MSLLQMSFSGAVMVLAVLAVRAVALHRLPKRTFVLLWELALLRLLVPVAVPSAYSIYTLFARRAPRMALPGPAAPAIPPGLSVLPTAPAAAAPPAPAAGAALPVWGLVWAAGALVCACAFAVAWLGCHARFAAALPLDTGFAAAWLARHPLRRRVTARSCARIDAPLTFGLLRPVILLPETALQLPPEQLRCILLHEHIHIRRWDGAIKLAAAAALCLHWFDPLVWVLYVLLNRDLELACDEQVVWELGHGARAVYAGTLIDMKERQSGFMPLYSHFSKTAIEERIVTIMKNKPKDRRLSALGLCVAGAVALLFGTTACGKAPAAPSAPASSSAVEEQAPAASTPADADAPQDAAPTPRPATATLVFTVEGEEEEQPATLYAGDGWSLYIPDEGWTATDAGTWASTDNSSVWFRISAPAGQELSNLQALWDAGRTDFTDNAGGMAMAHRLYVGPDGTLWDACARYPQEAAEGFGARIPVILGTLEFTAGAGANASASDEKAALLDAALAFTNAYLDADSQAAQALLAEGYAGDEDLYSGAPVGEERKLDATCLEEVTAEEVAGAVHNVSVRFVDPESGDSYLYLTLELVKQADGWKVRFYGLEG